MAYHNTHTQMHKHRALVQQDANVHIVVSWLWVSLSLQLTYWPISVPLSQIVAWLTLLIWIGFRWHNLTIEHSGRQVSVYLDGDVTSRTVKNTDFFLSLDPLAYIGGGDNFVITRGILIFVGVTMYHCHCAFMCVCVCVCVMFSCDQQVDSTTHTLTIAKCQCGTGP